MITSKASWLENVKEWTGISLIEWNVNWARGPCRWVEAHASRFPNKGLNGIWALKMTRQKKTHSKYYNILIEI